MLICHCEFTTDKVRKHVTTQVANLQDEDDFGKPEDYPDRGHNAQRGFWPASKCG